MDTIHAMDTMTDITKNNITEHKFNNFVATNFYVHKGLFTYDNCSIAISRVMMTRNMQEIVSWLNMQLVCTLDEYLKLTDQKIKDMWIIQIFFHIFNNLEHIFDEHVLYPGDESINQVRNILKTTKLSNRQLAIQQHYFANKVNNLDGSIKLNSTDDLEQILNSMKKLSMVEIKEEEQYMFDTEVFECLQIFKNRLICWIQSFDCILPESTYKLTDIVDNYEKNKGWPSITDQINKDLEEISRTRIGFGYIFNGCVTKTMYALHKLANANKYLELFGLEIIAIYISGYASGHSIAEIINVTSLLNHINSGEYEYEYNKLNILVINKNLP
jgi:hypothetical protein